MIDAIRRRISSLERLRELPVEALCAMLTFLLVLLWANITWVIAFPIYVVAVAGILFPKLRTGPRVWCVLTALMALSLAWDWHHQDNHQFVYVYICLALFLAFHFEGKQRSRVLADGCRLLVGAMMAFAAGWKLMTADYSTGAFFHHELLVHESLSDLAVIFGGLSPEVPVENAANIELLTAGYLTAEPVESVVLEGTGEVAVIAAVVTWWTVLIEALIAALFLWPRRLGGGHRYVFYARHVALIAFMLMTYVFAPVIGFGWALVVLGLGCCAVRPTWFRPAYLVIVVLLLALRFITW